MPYAHSFAEQQVDDAAARDAWAARVLLAIFAVAFAQQHPSSTAAELALGAAIVAGLAGVATATAAAPAAYRRWRRPALAALRLLATAGAVLSVDLPRHVPGDLASVGTRGALQGWLHFGFAQLLGVSGVVHLLLTALGFGPLPPLEHAAVQLLAAGLIASANTRSCSSEFARHPDSVARMETSYAWLEPLIVYVEPLLLLAGVRPGHPLHNCYAGEARCVCKLVRSCALLRGARVTPPPPPHTHPAAVLAALQLWVGVLLPVALVVHIQGCSYISHLRHVQRRRRVVLPRQHAVQRWWTLEWQYLAAARAAAVMGADSVCVLESLCLFVVVTLQLSALHSLILVG